MSDALRELPRVSLRHQVADEIRAAILEGRLRPGEKIPEQDLARQLGVSRVPVREAIRLLEQEGLVVVRPQSGTYVAVMTEQELEDGARLRAVLEAFAVEQALTRLTTQEWDALVNRLEGLLADMRQAADSKEWVRITQIDLEWHTAIVEASRNGVLLKFWQTLGLPIRFLALRRILGAPSPDGHIRAIGHHAELLSALRTRDLAAAQAAVHFHVVRHLTH